MTDDFLDEEWPPNDGILALLNRGILPYGLLLFGVSLFLHLPLALSLFCACYSVGMLGSPHTLLPSRLSASLEGALVLLFSLIACGFAITLWSYLVILAIQLLDDLLDYEKDEKKGRRSFAHRWGLNECRFAFLLLFFICLSLQPWYSFMAFLSSLFMGEFVFQKTKERRS